MRHRLGQPDSLSHPLAVGAHFSIGGIQQVHTFQRSDCELGCLLLIEAVNQQERMNEFTASQSSRKRVELRAVTYFAKELFGPVGGDAEERHTAASRTK